MMPRLSYNKHSAKTAEGKTKKNTHTRNQTVRIIAGKYRSRTITFSSHDNVRPTTDRARETLFNWLMPYLDQAQCLDLFAGSGILGIESLSRGAAHCTFIDNHSDCCKHITKALTQLQNNQFSCVCANLPNALFTENKRFDIVFLDPPYTLADSLLPRCLEGIVNRLATGALVYLELSQTQALPSLPSAFTVHRSKSYGQSQHVLLRYKTIACDDFDAKSRGKKG